ncbi:MAG: hypothetical protein IKE43_08400 [Coriobacteriales bacterium]|nr:hypothetical protein [Coriobacteriales bacterium]
MSFLDKAFRLFSYAVSFVLACGLIAGCLALTGCLSSPAADSANSSALQVNAKTKSTTQTDNSSDKKSKESASKGSSSSGSNSQPSSSQTQIKVKKNGTYTSKEEVALYIHTYNRLPSNFISKTKAKQAGWVASEGNLDEVCPGKSIGGGPFYNDDGILPSATGRTWKECDINYHGGFRGSERIVYSNDGLIFYTNDHYKTFEQLY